MSTQFCATQKLSRAAYFKLRLALNDPDRTPEAFAVPTTRATSMAQGRSNTYGKLLRLAVCAGAVVGPMFGHPATPQAQTVADRPTGTIVTPDAAIDVATSIELEIAADRSVIRTTRAVTTIRSLDGATKLTAVLTQLNQAALPSGTTVQIRTAAGQLQPVRSGAEPAEAATSKMLSPGDQLIVTQKSTHAPLPGTSHVHWVERIKPIQHAGLPHGSQPPEMRVRHARAEPITLDIRAAKGPDGQELPVTHEQHQDQTHRMHRITAVVAEASQPEPAAIETPGAHASVVITTLPSLDAAAAAIAKNFATKDQAPKELDAWIDALARDITLGSTSPQQQVVAIDQWLKSQIRIQTTGGSAREEPPADLRDTVITRTGTRKSKALLMQRLIEARGLTAHVALVDAAPTHGYEPRLSLHTLDRATTILVHVPALSVWFDPSHVAGASGVLPLGAYDKPALVLPIGQDAHSERLRVPAMRADQHTSRTVTRLTITRDGVLSGETQQEFTGALASMARSWTLTQIAIPGEDVAARAVEELGRSWDTPATGKLTFDSPSSTADPYRITSTFTLDRKWSVPRRGNLALPIGLPVLGRPGLGYLGAPQPFRQTPVFCMSGTQSEVVELTFDPELPLPALPPNRTIDVGDIAYTATFTIKHRTLRAERIFTARQPSQMCRRDMFRDHAATFTQISNSLRAYLPFGAGNLSSGEPGTPFRSTFTPASLHRSQ